MASTATSPEIAPGLRLLLFGLPGSGKSSLLAALAAFLKRLKKVRGQRADVAGLPIYLVLTKCDLLSKPNDTFAEWQQRIEEEKRKLGERISPLVRDLHAGHFGSIRLRVWATAVSRPSFADGPAPATEPYGVIELFRQCFVSAEAFDRS